MQLLHKIAQPTPLAILLAAYVIGILLSRDDKKYELARTVLCICAPLLLFSPQILLCIMKIWLFFDEGLKLHPNTAMIWICNLELLATSLLWLLIGIGSVLGVAAIFYQRRFKCCHIIKIPHPMFNKLMHHLIGILFSGIVALSSLILLYTPTMNFALSTFTPQILSDLCAGDVQYP